MGIGYARMGYIDYNGIVFSMSHLECFTKARFHQGVISNVHTLRRCWNTAATDCIRTLMMYRTIDLLQLFAMRLQLCQ